MYRAILSGLAMLSLAACTAAEDAPPDKQTEAKPPVPAVSAAQSVLTDVWQAAHPGATPPDLPELAASFDQRFQIIARAENAADDAMIKSTLAFIKSVKPASPQMCAEAPLARFTTENLATVPETALPAFRAMLTDRLATIANGARQEGPLEALYSGSMQSFSEALDDSFESETPAIASGEAYDPIAECTATIKGWEALDEAVQSPQLYHMLYGMDGWSA